MEFWRAMYRLFAFKVLHTEHSILAWIALLLFVTHVIRYG